MLSLGNNKVMHDAQYYSELQYTYIILPHSGPNPTVLANARPGSVGATKWHYNHFIPPLYLRRFSTDWPEILHDESLSWKDQVYGQNSDPAALKYYMQCFRTSKN